MHWGLGVRAAYKVFALLFTLLLLALPGFGAEPGIDLEKACASKGGAGIYYKDMQNPGQAPKVVCLDELMRMACQPLGLLRNYLYYTAGYCFRTPNYRTLFPRPGCNPDNNDAVIRSAPPQMGEMIFIIRGIEIRKDCVDPYAIHDPWTQR